MNWSGDKLTGRLSLLSALLVLSDTRIFSSNGFHSKQLHGNKASFSFWISDVWANAVLVLLLGFPAAAVCPAGCGARSWRLRSSLGRLRPPCTWNRKETVQTLHSIPKRASDRIQPRLSLSRVMKHFLRPCVPWTHRAEPSASLISAQHATPAQCSLFHKSEPLGLQPSCRVALRPQG